MRYTLEDIFSQAEEDYKAINLDGESYQARILYGCKISLDEESETITIHNTALGGDYYRIITDEQKEYFKEKGWRLGVYNVCIETYHLKLQKIEDKIKDEMNTKQNPKQIKHLKTHRERIIKMYNKINTKIKTESYE